MAQLIIDIPDELAQALKAHPLPLPPDEYCTKALTDAILRTREITLLSAAEVGRLQSSAPPRTDSPPTVYTLKEVADLLRVSVDKVTSMTASGQLACVRLGRRRVVPARAVEALLAGE